jgi:sugar phosphate isomerase/epimerase
MRNQFYEEVNKMKLGCNTVLFNQLDLYGALQHIAWAGYDGAELAFLGSMAQHIELNSHQTYIHEVKSIAKKHKLELYAIEATTNAGVGVPDELREDNLKYMSKIFEVASKLGIPLIAIGSGGRSGDKEVTNQVFEYIKKLGEVAESWDISLAVKPHVGASVYNIETVLKLLHKVDSPSVGINFDPSHLYRAGEDLEEAVLKIGERIIHSHFRDCPHTKPHPGLPEQQVPGRGKIDISRTLKALNDIGYDGVLDLEVIGAFTYPLSKQMAIAAESRGYLHRCLQEIKMK